MKKLLLALFVSVSFTANAWAYGSGGCDKYAVYTLHMNGVGTAFTDADCDGNGPIGVTAVGSATQSGLGVKGNFGGVYLGDGAGDRLSTVFNNAFEIGTLDFTVDGWFRWAATGGNYFLWSRGGDASNDFNIFHTSNQFFVYFNNSAIISSVGFTPTLGQWYHLALVRFGSEVSLYVDGARVATATSAASITSGTGLMVGDREGSQSFNGNIDEFRLSKGIARWSGPSFSVPGSQYCSGCENVGGI